MLMRLPLYLGGLLFLASFFLSISFRDRQLLVLGEGDIFDLPWTSTLFRVVRVEPALEKNALRTDGSLIFDYEPGIVIMDRKGEQFNIKAYPPKKVHSIYMHVLNFGIGPGIEVKKNGETIMKGEVALSLTPFGTVDRFEVEPYTFYLSILPNRVIKKGNETGREYNLQRPLYRLEVVKGDKTILKTETDSQASFDGGMSITFFPPADWILLEAVYDPFLLIFALSLLLIFIGLITRLLLIILPSGLA